MQIPKAYYQMKILFEALFDLTYMKETTSPLL